ILAHPSLEWERATTATRGGGHTGSLLGENLTPALKATEGMIRREVDWYISELSKDVYPDFRKLIPHQYHINLWAVVIEKTGYQIPHLHSSGWLSGVFYLQIPSSIRFDDNTQAGWIEFGKPGYDLPYQGDYPLLKIFPEAGKLILFPSYVFHRTIPTIGQDRRISVAFDIVPDDAVGRRR
ncbi:MAG: putative 2OG-Fe(II) oxygenase, partial [Alphaproteobacteria bacterium]